MNIENIYLEKIKGYEKEFNKLLLNSCEGDNIDDLINFYKEGIYAGRFMLYNYYDDFNFLENDKKNDYILVYLLHQYYNYIKGLSNIGKKFVSYLAFSFFDNNINEQLMGEFNYFIFNDNKINFSFDLKGNNNIYYYEIKKILNKVGLKENYFLFTIEEEGDYIILFDIEDSKFKNKVNLKELI